jgi:hypothetical protein
MLDDILKFLGMTFTFSLASFVGFFAFLQFFGKKWFENKFSKNLEEFKVQKLHEFNILFNRQTKWQDKEHEVLSESWKKLKNSQNDLAAAVSMLRELPDFDRKTEQEIQSYLNNSDFDESEKEYFNKESNKNNAYITIMDYRELAKANKSYRSFHEYFDHNRIFLNPDIKEKFDNIDKLMWSVWVSRKMGLNRDTGEKDFTIEAYNKLEKEVKPLIVKIEMLIQSKLFPEQDN